MELTGCRRRTRSAGRTMEAEIPAYPPPPLRRDTMRATDQSDRRSTRTPKPGQGRRPGPRSRSPRACSVTARKVEVYRPGRLPPAAKVHPLLTFYVAEDGSPGVGAPQLHELFVLLDEVGAAEVHRRTAARTSWRLVGSDHPRVALRLEISAPAAAHGVIDLIMDADAYRQAWQLIRDGQWIGITSAERLPAHADGSALGIDEVFAACIPVDTTPPPALDDMLHDVP